MTVESVVAILLQLVAMPGQLIEPLLDLNPPANQGNPLAGILRFETSIVDQRLRFDLLALRNLGERQAGRALSVGSGSKR